MPKIKRDRGASKASRLAPLESQLAADAERQFARQKKNRQGKARRKEKDAKEDAEDAGVVPSDLSRKIMSIAREQLDEEKQERLRHKREARAREQQVQQDDSDAEDGDDLGRDDDSEGEMDYLNEDEFRKLKVHEEDERALESFMSGSKPERRTLADIIMEKIREKEERAAGRAPGGGAAGGRGTAVARTPGLNPRLVEVYQSIGGLLSRYRAGKIPKAFKIIPALRNWEEVLYYTNPDGWSPQAMRAATRLFASNLNQKMAQRFYALVLMPAVRDDIAYNKKLNYHYYMALKKSVYRPAAFFKGILLPLCEEGDCTLREATIIGSVLSKVSIPMVHSAVAMLKMASMPYAGATSLFLRVLMDKKYSLPYKVVDMLVIHFLDFRKETRRLPVLWHQALLVFAQRYKTALTADQKEALKPLMRQHFHHMITSEIRRELFNSASRNPAQSKKR